MVDKQAERKCAAKQLEQKQMAILTQTLQEILENVNGASFVGLDTLTAVTLKGGQKNPHQGRVTKLNQGASVMVFQNKKGSSYEGMVHRRMKEEGLNPETFKVGPRVWGERIPETPFITHNGELYLEVIFLKGGESTLFVDGQVYDVEKHGVIDGLPVDKEPSESSQGGIERQVIIRTFKAASIKQIRVNKEEYVPML